jgi:hypothetical protein
MNFHAPSSPARVPADAVHAWLRAKLPQADLGPGTALADVLDSLAFLDFYLFLEQLPGVDATLDDVAGCATYGDLRALLHRTGTPA